MSDTILTVDMSGERPLITINGSPVKGIVRADIEITSDTLPTLVLRVVAFEVTEAELPRIPDFGKLRGIRDES